MIMLSLYSTAWLTLTATVGQLQQSDIPHQEPAIITNISRYMEPHYINGCLWAKINNCYSREVADISQHSFNSEIHDKVANIASIIVSIHT